MPNFVVKIWIFTIAAIFLTACEPKPENALTELQALNDAYTNGWKLDGLEAQEAVIMPLFTEDTVVLPSGGKYILDGKAELREFWFGDDTPVTTLLFEHTFEGAEVNGNLGTFHGRSKLDFEYRGQRIYQQATYLAVVRRSPSGEWQFHRLMWNDQPQTISGTDNDE